MTESALKNVGGAPIANHKYSTLNIYDQKSCGVGGTPRTNVQSADYHVKRNNIQSESDNTP